MKQYANDGDQLYERRMETPQPTRANVIILPLAGEKVSAGGIILMAEPSRNSPPRGLVIAIGPQVTEVAEGDEVFYNEHATKPLEFGDQTYLVVNIHDVLAKIDK